MGAEFLPQPGPGMFDAAWLRLDASVVPIAARLAPAPAEPEPAPFVDHAPAVAVSAVHSKGWIAENAIVVIGGGLILFGLACVLRARPEQPAVPPVATVPVPTFPLGLFDVSRRPAVASPPIAMDDPPRRKRRPVIADCEPEVVEAWSGWPNHWVA
jgi:hypothetical protein